MSEKEMFQEELIDESGQGLDMLDDMLKNWTPIANVILKNSLITPNVKAVYSIIRMHAYGKKINAFPGIKTIMEYTGLSNKTVTESIKKLEEVKLIEVERNRKDPKSGRRKSNLYKLLPIPVIFYQEQKEMPKKPKKEQKTVIKMDVYADLIAKMGVLKYPPLKHTQKILETNIKLVEEIYEYTKSKPTQSKAKVLMAFLNKQARMFTNSEKDFLLNLLNEKIQPKQIELALGKMGKVDDISKYGDMIRKIALEEQQKTENKYKQQNYQKPATFKTTVDNFSKYDHLLDDLD